MAKYPQIRKRARVIPFGYKVSDHDPKLLDPIEKELDLLQQAFTFLKTCSVKQVAKWLSHASGRSLTAMGLWKMQQKRKADAQKRYYENKKTAERRRKVEERDRELRRTVAEAKEAERIRSIAGNAGKEGTVAR